MAERHEGHAQARLDRFIDQHRFAIAVVVPLVGAVLLVASADGRLPSAIAFNPWLLVAGSLVMRLPLVAAIAPVVDRRFGVALLAATGFTYAIEFVGLTTGFPYGEFRYLVDIGPALNGLPVGLPLFFLPLVVNAYLVVLVLFPTATRLVRVPAVVCAVLAVDLVLDPAAVAIGFWAYAADGVYYGVPLSNFGGWLFSATIVVVAVDTTVDRARLRRRLDACDFALDDVVSFTLLWGVVNALVGHWVPVALAVVLAGAVAATGRFDVPAPRWATGSAERPRS